MMRWTGKIRNLSFIACTLFAAFSCSHEQFQYSDDQQQTDDGSINITIGAGINDNGSNTRSAVNQEGSIRTLTFTDGDRLYVYAKINNNGDSILAGFLNIDANSITNTATAATFTGSLSVFEKVNTSWVAANWTPATAHPLAECDTVIAKLVHKDAGTTFQVREDHIGSFWAIMTTDVNTLMTTGLCVKGTYSAGSIALSASSQPIINCTLTDLDAGATYKVEYWYGVNAFTETSRDLSLKGATVQADANGQISFAFIGKAGDSEHAIYVKNANSNDARLVNLGRRTLENKVYNLTRSASYVLPQLYVCYVDDGDSSETPVEKTEGAYNLNGYCKLYGMGIGNINSRGDSELFFMHNTRIMGQVHHTNQYDVNDPYHVDAGMYRLYGDVTIDNPGGIALKADGPDDLWVVGYKGHPFFDSVIEEGSDEDMNRTLTINGNVTGSIFFHSENILTNMPDEYPGESPTSLTVIINGNVDGNLSLGSNVKVMIRGSINGSVSSFGSPHTEGDYAVFQNGSTYAGNTNLPFDHYGNSFWEHEEEAYLDWVWTNAANYLYNIYPWTEDE